MQIKELYITEFGCIKNRKIEFSDDKNLNIIYGENESGKSTVLLFIKFMLYGMPRKSQTNIERDRSLSFSSGVAAGSLTLVHGGKEYRIERSFSDRARGEKLSLIDLDRGEAVVTDKTVGEYFLGVPREVFESTACTGQMHSTEINGEKTAQSLSNMLAAADESIDTASILKELNTIRASYLHKNQAGGSLYEDESKIKAYKIKLDEARNASLAIEGKSENFEKIKAEYNAVKLELETKDALVAQFNKIAVLKRFETLRQKEALVPQISEKKEAFAKEGLSTDFFPTRNHIAELSISSRELEKSEKRLADKEAEKSELVAVFDSDAADLGKIVEDNDGAEEMLAPNKNMREKAAKLRNIGLAFVGGIAALSMGAVAGFFLAGLICCLILASLAFCSLIGGVIFFAKASKLKKKSASELATLAASFSATSDTLEARMEECLSELAKKREYQAKNAKLEAELEVAEESFEAARAYAYSLLKLSLGEDVEPICENIEAEVARLDKFLEEYEKLAREEDAFLRMLENERNALARYDEEKLRGEISVDIASATPEAVDEAERTRSFLAAKKNAYESRITMLQNELIALRIKATDPMPIADKLASLEEKVQKDREFYDALVLAMNTLENASASIRGSVTPIITKSASELMARISDKKYTMLRTNSTLGVTLDKDGYGIKSELLSGGTKDAAYLSLRLALIMHIFEGEYPPVIFDESFCQLDDSRLEKTLELLSSLSKEGMQILLFTSHKRERAVCEASGYNYSLVEM